MNLPTFDQSRKHELTSYGESVRLSNELRAKPEQVYNFGLNKIPVRWGFDCETAPYSDFVSWLSNTNIKKSKSLFWFVIRIMAWRFPDKHTEIRNNLTDRRRLEFDLILSQMKKEFEWVGLVGYQNMVELNPDSPLNKNNMRIIKKNNDVFRWAKK